MPQKVANKKIYIDRGVNIFCRTTQILYLFELYIGGPTNDHIVLYLIALKRKSIDKYVPFQIIYINRQTDKYTVGWKKVNRNLRFIYNLHKIRNKADLFSMRRKKTCMTETWWFRSSWEQNNKNSNFVTENNNVYV